MQTNRIELLKLFDILLFNVKFFLKILLIEKIDHKMNYDSN